MCGSKPSKSDPPPSSYASRRDRGQPEPARFSQGSLLIVTQAPTSPIARDACRALVCTTRLSRLHSGGSLVVSTPGGVLKVRQHRIQIERGRFLTRREFHQVLHLP